MKICSQVIPQNVCISHKVLLFTDSFEILYITGENLYLTEIITLSFIASDRQPFIFGCSIHVIYLYLKQIE